MSLPGQSFLPAEVRNTASDITNFRVGGHVVVDTNGQYESVPITKVFGNAFYAVYQYPHAEGFNIQSNPGGVGGGALTAPVAAGTNQVGISGTNYISAGDPVDINFGQENFERVVLTDVDGQGLTITATFEFAHEAGEPVQPVPINTVSTTGFTGITPQPILPVSEIANVYDDDIPVIVDPTLQYAVPDVLTTRTPDDFPGLSLRDPVVSLPSGQEVNPPEPLT